MRKNNFKDIDSLCECDDQLILDIACWCLRRYKTALLDVYNIRKLTVKKCSIKIMKEQTVKLRLLTSALKRKNKL